MINDGGFPDITRTVYDIRLENEVELNRTPLELMPEIKKFNPRNYAKSTHKKNRNSGYSPGDLE